MVLGLNIREMIAIIVGATVCLGGSLFFRFGLSAFRCKKVITIGVDRVGVDERLLHRRRRWEEPISNYKGILAESQDVSVGIDRGPNYTLYQVILWHDNHARSIKLFHSRDILGWRQRWEHAAKTLHLPALELTEEGVVERSARDLEKPVAKQIDESEIEVDHDLLNQDAKGIAVMLEGQEIVVTRQPTVLSVLSLVLKLSIAGLFVWVGFFSDEFPGFLSIWIGVIGSLFGFTVLIELSYELILHERLRLGDHLLSCHRVNRWVETKGQRRSVAGIKSVKVGTVAWRFSRKGLVITADRGEIPFGG